uniref:Glycosyl transferase family 25 domain-containing protein n=1 Tax=Meloidogyne incognita TaxID=6306 RepID=A0A914KNM9_MELIC
MNIPILFSNHFYYGYFLYPSMLNSEHASLYSTFLAHFISDSGSIPFPSSSVLPSWYPYETKFGFDQIYLINLARRPERLNKMSQILRLVGMKFERFEAVDGQNLTKRQLDSLNFLPGYLDPNQRRPMKLGEIGCFLSHYKVWKDVLANGYDRAIVLEDDMKFTQNGTLIIQHSWPISSPILVQFHFHLHQFFHIGIQSRQRPERLNKMSQILRLVGMKFERFEAVDGQNLTKRQLDSLNFLPGYLDPNQRRPMKLGEIGCFLSHYKVWKDVLANGYDRAIVLEDDMKFTQNGTLILNKVVQDLMKTRLDWDFIYFGRRRNKGGNPEFFVSGHTHLSTISYSYWTIGYAISLSGAKKLIEADPLNNLLTLDEFLPIMYSQHPNQIWSRFFEDKEKLNAFAVYPLILEPERYSFHSDFLSDTEGSEQDEF